MGPSWQPPGWLTHSSASHMAPPGSEGLGTREWGLPLSPKTTVLSVIPSTQSFPNTSGESFIRQIGDTSLEASYLQHRPSLEG